MSLLGPPVPDHELPDELPERFTGSKRMTIHMNYGNGGGGIYRWHDAEGRMWPIQEQYDTRRPQPAKGKKPAFEPAKTGVVIVDQAQPDGFYGDVCAGYRELREVWKRWRAEKKAAAAAQAEAVQP